MKHSFQVQGLSCENCVVSLTKLLQSHYDEVHVTLRPPMVTLGTDGAVDVETLNTLLADSKFSVREQSILGSLLALVRFYLPLICIFSLVILFTFLHGFLIEFTTPTLMQYFMAGYFLIFGGLKVINWRRFVLSYSQYDALAKRYTWYRWSYPGVEFGLGVLYYLGLFMPYISAFVFLLMLQKASSVRQKLHSGEVTQCACLGGFFSIPVTKVTFFEDLMMAGMAVLMLV